MWWNIPGNGYPEIATVTAWGAPVGGDMVTVTCDDSSPGTTVCVPPFGLAYMTTFYTRVWKTEGFAKS